MRESGKNDVNRINFSSWRIHILVYEYTFVNTRF